jgi:UDP-glucose 4-epimerase
LVSSPVDLLDLQEMVIRMSAVGQPIFSECFETYGFRGKICRLRESEGKDSTMKIENGHFLITGGSGFIGAYVAELLLNQKASRVVLFDKVINENNVAELRKDARVSLVEGDLLNQDALKRVCQGINGIFHMAVLPLGPCDKDPQLAFEVNIRGTFGIVQEAIRAGAGKFVYSSASSVYGDTLEVMNEQHPFNARSMYGVTKLCGELLLRPFESKLPYAIVRYMNVYGPRQVGGLIPAVLGKILSGQAPVINGDGSASFDFIHVRDVARCTVLAMASDVSGEAFNVGSGTEVTVKEITLKLLELCRSPLQPVYQPQAAGSMTRRVGSSEKAKRLLGFRAETTLHQGLVEIVKGS